MTMTGEAEGIDQQLARRAAVALRSMGHPNSIARQFDFWDDSYEWRRLFAEVLGTFFLVLVAGKAASDEMVSLGAQFRALRDLRRDGS
jgi:hypothetical protein